MPGDRYERYMKYIDKGQLEMVLETAAADPRLTDKEYDKLVDAASSLSLDRRSGKARLLKMADREFGRSELRRLVGIA